MDKTKKRYFRALNERLSNVNERASQQEPCVHKRHEGVREALVPQMESG